ncbi:hypothetical protein [Nostoc sp.]|uniref:hypothetical protein n=1 Tax=Nostoc sp. TaxID=1180 RepID=UPI002FF55A44
MTLKSYVSYPANTRLPNIVRSLPILLLLGDIFGLLICLAIAFKTIRVVLLGKGR